MIDIRKTFFPRARAKGSCCLRLPLGVWIEIGPMPDRAGTIEKSSENLRFFSIFGRASRRLQVSLQQQGAARGNMEPGQMSSVETRQMPQQQSSVLTGQMSAVETGQISVAGKFVLS